MDPDKVDDGINIVYGWEFGQFETDQVAKLVHQGNQHWSARKGLANHTNVLGAVLDKLQGNVIQGFARVVQHVVVAFDGPQVEE